MKLPIRQNLNRLASLNRTHRAVLIEVCELAENGKRGAFDGNNEYLAKRLAATPRTISRALSHLEQLALLAVIGATCKRQVKPTDTLRACYIGADAEAATLALSIDIQHRLSIDTLSQDTEMSIDNQGVSIDNRGQCLETTEVVSIDKQGRAYIETTNNDHLTTINDQAEEIASLRSALALVESELVGEREKVDSLTAERDKLLADVADLKNNAQASRTRGAGRRRAEKPPAGSAELADYELPAWASPLMLSKLGAWLRTRQTRPDCAPLQAKAIQARFDELARYDEPFCLNLLEKAEQNPQWQGLTFQDTPIKFAQYLQAKQQHGNRQHATSPHFSNRSGAGAKPDLRAGQMAAASAYAPGDTSGLPWGQSGPTPH